MTRAEFGQRQAEVACRSCGKNNARLGPGHAAHPGGQVECGSCGSHIFWLALEKNKDKRPSIPTAHIEAVWEKYQNHRAQCGLNTEHLKILGSYKTVGHVPPYFVAGEKARLIPLCSWCNQDGEATRKRMTRLITHTLQKMGANDPA